MFKLRTHEIESYIRGKGLQLRRRGSKAEAKVCPFCQGGDNSDVWTFVVYLDDTGGNYKCMRGSCDVTGSFWQLVEHFGDDPKEFYDKDDYFTPKKKESQIVAELKPDLSFPPINIEPQKLTPEALQYLEKRGFNAEILEHLPIWCDKDGLINFGYYHEGDLCFVKKRKPSKPQKDERKSWAIAGGLRTLYMLEMCDLSKPYIVITFGEYDAIALKHAGIENVVSVPSGDSDLEWISICYDILKPLKEIYLWTDNDDSGITAFNKIKARLGERRIKHVQSKYKDANEMFLKEQIEHGYDAARDAVFNCVNDAKWIYKGDVIQFADIENKETSFEGIKTNLEVLDRNLGGSLYGRIILVTGSNKSGKSVLINQLTGENIEGGAVACVYAGEDEISTYKYNMQVHIGGYEATEVRTSKAGADYAFVKPEYKPLIDDWARNRLFVISRKSGLNEDSIIENFQLAYERFGCVLFVVDNLMKLVAAKDTNNLNNRQTQVMNKLTDFAQENNVIVYVLAHTNKQDDERSPPKSSREVAGAKEIVNLCDSAINIFRVPPDLQGEYNGADAVLTILENRVFGIKTSQNLYYDWRIRRFAENSNQFINAKYNYGKYISNLKHTTPRANKRVGGKLRIVAKRLSRYARESDLVIDRKQEIEGGVKRWTRLNIYQ